MSSIVIAGDTSGSVTLQAPAVAGSTVLNLPATSGTIQTSGAGYTTNGVAYASSASALTTGSALIFNGTNLGVGVTPSTWSEGSAIERKFAGTADWGYLQAESYRTTNAYFNGGWKYGGTGAACKYGQVGGTHEWSTAVSGTAGNAISFTQTMTLTPAGNLALGYTGTDVLGGTARLGVFNYNNDVTLAIVGGNYTTPNKAQLYLTGGFGDGGTRTSGWYVRSQGYGGGGNINNRLDFVSQQTNGGSEVIMASIDPSGTLMVGTTTVTGSATNASVTISGLFQTTSGSVSAPSSTATTVATLPNVNYGTWIVCIALSTGVAATWSSTYVLNTQGTSSNIGTLLAGSGSGLGISMSGTTLRVQQGSGATQTIYWSITRIF